MSAAARTLPRRDRWVIVLVAIALAALILGFAASAPAFEAPVSALAGMDDPATMAPLPAPAPEVIEGVVGDTDAPEPDQEDRARDSVPAAGEASRAEGRSERARDRSNWQ